VGVAISPPTRSRVNTEEVAALPTVPRSPFDLVFTERNSPVNKLFHQIASLLGNGANGIFSDGRSSPWELTENFQKAQTDVAAYQNWALNELAPVVALLEKELQRIESWTDITAASNTKTFNSWFEKGVGGILQEMVERRAGGAELGDDEAAFNSEARLKADLGLFITDVVRIRIAVPDGINLIPVFEKAKEVLSDYCLVENRGRAISEAVINCQTGPFFEKKNLKPRSESRDDGSPWRGCKVIFFLTPNQEEPNAVIPVELQVNSRWYCDAEKTSGTPESHEWYEERRLQAIMNSAEQLGLSSLVEIFLRVAATRQS